MTINPERLKQERNRRGLSQADLAEKCTGQGRSVSKESIYRYEAGKTKPTMKKAKWIAEALGVTVGDLSAAPAESSFDELLGSRKVSVLLQEDARLNLRLVHGRYGVSPQEVLNAAPWMFALLAEMSLADRKRRNAEWREKLEEAMAARPEHLSYDSVGICDGKLIEVMYVEDQSIINNDIIGDNLHYASDWACEGLAFALDEAGPFTLFVEGLASETGAEFISPRNCSHSIIGMPKWRLMDDRINALTGNDRWARFAYVEGYASEIPEDLMGMDRTEDRVGWMIAQIPSEVRQRAEQRLAELSAQLKF